MKSERESHMVTDKSVSSTFTFSVRGSGFSSVGATRCDTPSHLGAVSPSTEWKGVDTDRFKVSRVPLSQCL